MEEVLIAYTTLAQTEEASTLVRSLVDQKLVACATLLSAVQSLCPWQGRVETATEMLVMMKTLAGGIQRLSLPELLAVPVVKWLPAYLDWVRDETCPDISRPS